MDDLELKRLLAGDPVALYHACKEIDGLPGEGTFPIHGVRVQKFFVLVGRQFFYEPVSSYDGLLEWAQRKWLFRLAGVPGWALEHAGIAFRTFASARGAPKGVVQAPGKTEKEIGLHFVALTSGIGPWGDSLQFVNSWGLSWGDRGHGWLERGYVDQFMTEAWISRDARFGPSTFTWQRLVSAQTQAERRSAWMLENPRWRRRTRFRGYGHQLVLYEVLSVEDERPVEVIEIRDGKGRYCAWAHLFHVRRDDEPVSEAKEFFVWPWMRRRGYGQFLFDLVVERSKAWHSTRLLLPLNEADSVPAVRPASREFGKRMGISWRWRSSRRPRYAAIGEVAL
jgi:hypothetical protein